MVPEICIPDGPDEVHWTSGDDRFDELRFDELCIAAARRLEQLEERDRVLSLSALVVVFVGVKLALSSRHACVSLS